MSNIILKPEGRFENQQAILESNHKHIQTTITGDIGFFNNLFAHS
jgi:hypothetical protein